MLSSASANKNLMGMVISEFPQILTTEKWSSDGIRVQQNLIELDTSIRDKQRDKEII